MDRIINIKVGGNHLSKDSNKAGTRGEANVTTLRITFDEGWDKYAKSVLFLDAHGMNPTRRTLTTDLLENIVENTRIYLVPIPAEPMWLAGEMSFTVEGYVSGKRQRSVVGTLEVEDAIITDVVNDPTPSEVEQLQGQIDNIMGDIQRVTYYRTETENFANAAETSMGLAEAFKEAAAGHCFRADESALVAQQAQHAAECAADDAEQAKADVEALKQETIEEVGTLKQETAEALETAKQETVQALKQEATVALASVKQEALEEVETLKEDVGAYKAEATESANRATESANRASQDAQNAKESAEDAEEFANRAENAVIKTAYIGANGNWYVWDIKKNEYYDTGVRAQSGSEVYVGDNPPASADVWIKPDGGIDDIMARLEELERKIAKLIVTTVSISLLASKWVADGNKYSQIVTIEGVTPYSKVNLQPSAEQLVIFYEKDMSFVTENDNGVITVYCIGQKPTNDYVMQATITEVTTNE